MESEGRRLVSYSRGGNTRDGDEIILDDATEDHGPTIITARKPTWRDAFAIICGYYLPRLEVRQAITLVGADKILKRVYTRENVKWQDIPPLRELDDES